MNQEEINLSGPEVVLFIQENQKSPDLLEELSAMILQAEQEHQKALGVNTLNFPYLRTDQLENKTRNTTSSGYSLRVCLIKEDDAKDPDGWKELIFFLPTDEDGKIEQIVMLGEGKPTNVLNLDELGAADEASEELGISKYLWTPPEGSEPTLH